MVSITNKITFPYTKYY